MLKGISPILSPELLKIMAEMGHGDELVIADGNLSEETITWLGQHVTAPLLADPVSVKKAPHLMGALPFLTALKPNRPAASLRTGVEIRSHQDLPVAAQAFFDKGVKNVFISLGGEGVYFDNGNDRGILSCIPGAIINTNGCGDAFLAAAADGYSCARAVTLIRFLITLQTLLYGTLRRQRFHIPTGHGGITLASGGNSFLLQSSDSMAKQ